MIERALGDDSVNSYVYNFFSQNVFGQSSFWQSLRGQSQGEDSGDLLLEIQTKVAEILNLESLGINFSLADLGNSLIFYGKVALLLLFIVGMIYAIIVAFGGG